MSRAIVWAIPNELVEGAVQAQLGLESPVTVWGCQFDEIGLQIAVILEVDEEDLAKLHIDDMDCHVLEDGEFVQ